jgi:Aspartyl protease
MQELWGKQNRNKMRMKILALSMLFIVNQETFAQVNLPLLKANSPKVSIKDGWEGQTRYWNHLVKSTSPIVYHLAKNGFERKVTFYTDIDSISLKVKAESNYLFKVLLNKTDTCNVILTTKNHQYERITSSKNETDTLPFTLNRNKQIIVRGSLNNSSQMDFCVDLGARMVCVIGKGFDKPNKLVIDGMMEDESVTGLSTEKTSSNNSLQLGNLNIANIPVCYIDEAGFLENGGGLIGFNIFQNNILEIDFDNKLLIIHNKLPEKVSAYAPIEFKQTTGGLYIPVTINNGKKKSTGWYFFDTGADNALTFDSKFAARESMYNTMKVIGQTGIASSENKIIKAAVLEVPEVQIANFRIENTPALLAEESNAEAVFEDGVIGIGLQSRFNIIIDYPNSKMYLKPSKYFKDSFERNSNKTALIVWISLVSGFLLLILFIYKRAKRNKRQAIQKPSR